MLGMKTTRHPTSEQLYDYSHARLNEIEARAVAMHLEECPECAGKLEQGRRLLTVLGAATPAAYGAAKHRDVLRRALQSAAGTIVPTGWRKRLADWAAQEREFAGTVLKWTPATADEPTGKLKMVRTFTGSSSWHIQDAAMGREDAHPAEPRANIWATGATSIGVLVESWPARLAAPLLCLTSEDSRGRPQVKAPRRHPRLPAPLATFKVTRPGRYVLGLEPTPADAD